MRQRRKGGGGAHQQQHHQQAHKPPATESSAVSDSTTSEAPQPAGKRSAAGSKHRPLHRHKRLWLSGAFLFFLAAVLYQQANEVRARAGVAVTAAALGLQGARRSPLTLRARALAIRAARAADAAVCPAVPSPQTQRLQQLLDQFQQLNTMLSSNFNATVSDMLAHLPAFSLPSLPSILPEHEANIGTVLAQQGLRAKHTVVIIPGGRSLALGTAGSCCCHRRVQTGGVPIAGRQSLSTGSASPAGAARRLRHHGPGAVAGAALRHALLPAAHVGHADHGSGLPAGQGLLV
jgi:hypothetical protein